MDAELRSMDQHALRWILGMYVPLRVRGVALDGCLLLSGPLGRGSLDSPWLGARLHLRQQLAALAADRSDDVGIGLAIVVRDDQILGLVDEDAELVLRLVDLIQVHRLGLAAEHLIVKLPTGCLEHDHLLAAKGLELIL